LKVVVKRTKFWIFFALPNFKRAVPPKPVYTGYKIGSSADHRAKFHASQPTHLGDLALKKIKYLQ